jgi:ATP synthase assembly factor FMC1, mitochondrial
MSTTTTPAKLRSLYRSLLRELPPRPILRTPRSPVHKSLHKTFLQSQPQSQSKSQQKHHQKEQGKQQQITIAQAEQFIQYLRAQRTYTTLLERYNPGMGMDEEERVRLTARRVGMDLPVEYGPPDSSGNGNGNGNGEGGEKNN